MLTKEVTSVGAIVVGYEKLCSHWALHPSFIVSNPPHVRSTVMIGPTRTRSAGNLSEQEGDQTHIEHELVDLFVVSQSALSRRTRVVVGFMTYKSNELVLLGRY